MSDTISSREAASSWNITERRVRALCARGRIPGAEKDGRRWVLPADAPKPPDGRVRSGIYRKLPSRSGRLPLPIGVSDYRLASSEYYYADKTMMIKDILDERPMVSLFTRPRRFGKTLNMDMLRTFFEKTDEDTSVYFADRLIWKQGKKYRDHQGKYPVIFITFKDVKKNCWALTLDTLAEIVSAEYRRHGELADSPRIRDGDWYRSVVNGTADRNLLDRSLYMLSKMLHEHHGVPPVVIVDEYDVPIGQGYLGGFYDDVILFMRNMFSAVFKDNRHISFGFLTGVLRVAKESIFSGLNNLTVNSVLDDRYSGYFGFTEDEVREMARLYSDGDCLDVLREWYGGYRFGRTEIYNPWSVLNFFRNGCRPAAYWQSTGSNEVIGEILRDTDAGTGRKLADLIDGKTALTPIDTGVVYPEVRRDPSSVFSFLLVAGYLTAAECDSAFATDCMCRVAIPNRETDLIYRKEILRKMEGVFPSSSVTAIQEALYTADSGMLRKHLRNLLLASASSFDTVGENFYHGLMLGLSAAFRLYETSSNRESGEGRYDIQLKPKTRDLPGILIELKAGKNCGEEALDAMAQSALKQIRDKSYDAALRAAGIEKIIRFGVAFSGKNVSVAAE